VIITAIAPRHRKAIQSLKFPEKQGIFLLRAAESGGLPGFAAARGAPGREFFGREQETTAR
jgi:hypothetical protein